MLHIEFDKSYFENSLYIALSYVTGVQESHDDDWELIGVGDIPTMPEEPR